MLVLTPTNSSTALVTSMLSLARAATDSVHLFFSTVALAFFFSKSNVYILSSLKTQTFLIYSSARRSKRHFKKKSLCQSIFILLRQTEGKAKTKVCCSVNMLVNKII